MSETRDLSLAEKVEGLAGPCRETDGEVWRAVLTDAGFVWNDIDGVWHLRDEQDTVAFQPPPAFTASLDAVVELIEKELPGWYFEVSGGSPESCAAIMLSPDRIKFADDCWDAASPALALLTVFLRTRAAFLRAKGEQNGNA